MDGRRFVHYVNNMCFDVTFKSYVNSCTVCTLNIRNTCTSITYYYYTRV